VNSAPVEIGVVAIACSCRRPVDGDALVEQFEHPVGGGVVDGGVADADGDTPLGGWVHDGYRDGRVGQCVETEVGNHGDAHALGHEPDGGGVVLGFDVEGGAEPHGRAGVEHGLSAGSAGHVVVDPGLIAQFGQVDLRAAGQCGGRWDDGEVGRAPWGSSPVGGMELRRPRRSREGNVG